MDSKSTRSQVGQPAFSMEDFAKALDAQDYQFQTGEIVRGKVHNYERDGAYVDIGGKSLAFLPIAEASLGQVTDLSQILPLQQEQEFMIIREQNAEGQITISRRRLELKKVWAQLAEMQTNEETIAVRVSGLNKGGVMVDVQGLRGFIPRSHLVERDNLDTLKGQTLTVSFLEVNPDQNRLVLSQRQATRAASIGQLESGQLIEGRITGIKPFGVFVEFKGTTGLLHINQISKNYIASLTDLFQVGQPIKAVITDLDQQRGRISLSTRVLENFPGEMVEQTATVMEEAESRMEKVRKNLLRSGEEG
ncbi:30S ribosomal protein S1 [Leptolyngbya sp. 'hensonii']|uniref:S1 RNA-binding domain-containing protein n=1 Tax=Leptolyngbya sp. 'hensonii' TaxID=1922337 RepID=UPI00094FE422|nr:S1 RNA-binding domain-containing protein [Leptolyngbya sp. 'hensonii']OLP19910.1 30S ribosomal protein S1 [Leptolyngbya sp. 'hensonii']